MGLVALGRRFRADLAVSEIAFYKMYAIHVLRLETLDIKIIRSHAAAFTRDGGLSLGMIWVHREWPFTYPSHANIQIFYAFTAGPYSEIRIGW